MSFFKSLLGYLSFQKKIKSIKNKKIVFYSESKNYRNYLISLFKALDQEKEISTVYLTSDLNDLEKINNENYPIYIGNGFFRILLFSLIKCDMVLMTLTDLDNHEIKKSKYCSLYVYLFHSLVSTHKTYGNKAFNSYDVILSNGDYQKKEIEHCENLFKNKKKKIYNTGYTYLEILIKNKKNLTMNDKVLFAPSWNLKKKNLFNDHSLDVISCLINKNYSVVLRTHPELIKRSNFVLDEIKKKYKKNPKFKLNQDLNNLNPLNESSILITDNGGIALEYLIVQRKPVIYIEYSDKIHNDFYEKIQMNAIEDIFKNELGYSIDTSNLKFIDDYISEAKENFNKKKDKIEKLLIDFDLIIKDQSKNAKKVIVDLINNL